MVEKQANADLNQVLIDLGRSLLQYVGESWPWTGAHDSQSRERLLQLVARQQEAVGRLSELLYRREWPTDFGSYPVEYTDLHFVALDYLIGQLIENEQTLIAEIDATAAVCRDDAEAASLLTEIAAHERETLNQLRELAGQRAPAAN